MNPPGLWPGGFLVIRNGRDGTRKEYFVFSCFFSLTSGTLYARLCPRFMRDHQSLDRLEA